MARQLETLYAPTLKLSAYTDEIRWAVRFLGLRLFPSCPLFSQSSTAAWRCMLGKPPNTSAGSIATLALPFKRQPYRLISIQFF